MDVRFVPKLLSKKGLRALSRVLARGHADIAGNSVSFSFGKGSSQHIFPRNVELLRENLCLLSAPPHCYLRYKFKLRSGKKLSQSPKVVDGERNAVYGFFFQPGVEYLWAKQEKDFTRR